MERRFLRLIGRHSRAFLASHARVICPRPLKGIFRSEFVFVAIMADIIALLSDSARMCH